MTNIQLPAFNYRTTPDMVEHYLARDKQASDEMFLDTIHPMFASFLPFDIQAVLTKELNPTMKRSGRPSGKKASRHEVADYIEQSARIDLPIAFRDALVARLRSGERFTKFDRSKPLHKHLEKSRFKMTITYLYRHFYDLINVNDQKVRYEPLGEIVIPIDEPGRSMMAMVMVHNALSDLGMHHPAAPRMFNIMSEIP